MRRQTSNFTFQGAGNVRVRRPGEGLMKRLEFRASRMGLVSCVALSALCVSAAVPPDVAESLKSLQAYETGASLQPVKAVEAYAIRAMNDRTAREDLAAALATALGDSMTKPDAVAYLCHAVGDVGGAPEVPVLARLLGHERHADAARLALEAIPDPAAGAALLNALPGLTGKARIGVVH